MSAATPTLAATLPSRIEPRLQRFAARLVGSRLFWAIFIGLGFTLPLVRSVLRQLPPAPPVLGTLPAFALVDEAGRPFTNQILARRLVIAEFASPADVRDGSPLARLQTRVRNTGNAVHLVTFVRGEGDPASLETLARGAHAGAWRWSFATGAVDELEAATARGLRAPGSLEGKLLLVDGSGRIRRLTSPTKAELDLMMRDIGLLANIPSAEKTSR
jgi:hypothetical protein